MNIQLYKKYYECGDGCCSEWYGYYVIDGKESERVDDSYIEFLHDFLLEAGIAHEWNDTTEKDFELFRKFHKEHMEYLNSFNEEGDDE